VLARLVDEGVPAEQPMQADGDGEEGQG